MSRILVIDDDELVRRMIREMLTGQGHEVEDLPSGENAVSLQRLKAFELLITDIIMPGKEGLETIRDFRNAFPRVKIIAISGGGRIGFAPYLETARVLGAHKTMAKPFRPAELLGVVEELLGRGWAAAKPAP